MAVPGAESRAKLQDLHHDLLALTESKLLNIDRLVLELEQRIEEFQRFLEKPARNEKSRKALSSGTVLIDGLEYSVNEDFKQETIQLADFLDLDEVEAARLYMQGQEGSQTLDRSPLASAVIIFHQQRQFLAECLRLSLVYSANLEGDSPATTSDPVWQFVNFVTATKDGKPQSRATYWRSCLTFMRDIEQWLQGITERVQSMIMTGQSVSLEFTEIMDFQLASLNKQHESLGAIEFYLLSSIDVDDFHKLLSKLKSFEKYDQVLIHYIPMLADAIQQFATPQNAELKDAKALHEAIVTTNDQNPWTLRSLQAFAKVLWLPCFNSRFQDAQGLAMNTDDVEGPEKRSALFTEALRDGAFQFMLSISRDVRDDAWFDPLRHGITEFLTSDTALNADAFKTEKFFQQILMEPLTRFVQDFITYMPDTLRKLKVEEDEQRRQAMSIAQLHAADQELHLERFLIIIAYAYEGLHGDAEAFYERTGNLFGFLQWASQRQSTPRVAAFCEMLRTLSQSESCADLAHRFLLDEVSSLSGRSRRGTSLSWTHVFNELEFYSSTSRQKPALQSVNTQMDLVEPESTMMLECYLRLLSHLSRQSPKARQWILNHSSFHIKEHLLLLCSSSIESRLRACAFAALNGFLTQAEKGSRDSMWLALDSWISGGSAAFTNVQRPPQGFSSSHINEQLVLDRISEGFEEPNAFVELLQTLVSPTEDEAALCDSLPFPEPLGNTYRRAGIDPYVDFVFGRVLAAKSIELQDPIQLRIMRWNCLDFAKTCLSTFNEDLVIFANRSNISIDSAISTSTLETYVQIHPFARVMEWFFNEDVISALFAALEQNLQDVNASAPDSPLVLSITRSIQVIDLILQLQATYFEIVRPIVKLRSANRKTPVANSALASFEDAILNNLRAVSTLGLFCGSGHQDLVTCSITLLKRLCGARKLTAPFTGGGRTERERSRLIAALERNNEAETISRALIESMLPGIGEFEQGSAAPGIVIKMNLLEFLRESLTNVTNRPTVAHLLLGFQCYSHSLGIAPDGLYSNGHSLFHVIIKFLVDCPSAGADTMLSWLTSLKNESWQILARLWRSPMSANLVLPELRLTEFLFVQWLQQPLVGPDTLWDGKTIQDPGFYLGESAIGYITFLRQRAVLIDYVATELKYADIAGMMTLRNRLRSMLLGSLDSLDGSKLPCATLFDFVDFLRMNVSEDVLMPDSKFFQPADFDLCKKIDEGYLVYDIRSTEQLLRLRQNEVRKQGRLDNPADEKQLQADSQNLLQCFLTNNNRAAIQVAHIEALDSWVKLVVVFLGGSDLDSAQRNVLVAQGFQIMLPYFERCLYTDSTASTILGHLGKALLGHADLTDVSSGGGPAQDPVNDRLFRLFSLCLTGVQMPDVPVELRTLCYTICYEYLHKISRSSSTSTFKRHVLLAIKSLGGRLIEVTCDDAYAGQGLCKISSLVFLGGVVAVSNQMKSKDVVESLVRLNFTQIIVDNIRNISRELQESDDTAQFLSYHKASFALLLRISQTRFGAAHIMNAGFFGSVRASGLFSADPDIGLEIDNPKALMTYFQLLLAVLQILNAIILSRGPENKQTIDQVRRFLQENRASTVSIYKRNAKIGIAGDVSRLAAESEGVLVNLVDNLTILISACDFLASEQEQEQDQNPSIPHVFA